MTTYPLILLCALIAILLISGWAAFLIRHRQLLKLKKQVEDLEKEMLNNHRELVKLETELAKRVAVARKRAEDLK